MVDLMKSEGVQNQAQWIFAYGSLIWRPDFDSAGVKTARLDGYERRFWQASHDHRGTPEHPGRVVTLAPVERGYCDGLAYRLPETGREEILESLDFREKDGYQRAYVPLSLSTGESVSGLTWIACEGNPSWTGQESMDRIADVIASTHGPSGSNREYLYRLNKALNDLGIDDPHIVALTNHVQRLRA